MVSYLHQHKIPIAVATTSKRKDFELKSKHHQDLFSLFNCVITGDEVTRGKPAPDIFLLAAERLGIAPGPSVLVVEDALAGVQAAQAAGMSSLYVPFQDFLAVNAEMVKQPLVLKAKPTISLRSLLDFDPATVGLPCMVEVESKEKIVHKK